MIPHLVSEKEYYSDLLLLVVVDLGLKLADGRPRLNLQDHVDFGQSIPTPTKHQSRVGDDQRPLRPHWKAGFAHLAIKVLVAPLPGSGHGSCRGEAQPPSSSNIWIIVASLFPRIVALLWFVAFVHQR